MSRIPRLVVRHARDAELDAVYLNGRDVWGAGSGTEAYLRTCRTSDKYAAGMWYVLDDGGVVLSSLIVYRDGFALPAGARGIGSVATDPAWRGRGHASRLLDGVLATLDSDGADTVWLFSDIGAAFYERFGFRTVKPVGDAVCMVRGRDADSVPDDRLPASF